MEMMPIVKGKEREEEQGGEEPEEEKDRAPELDWARVLMFTYQQQAKKERKGNEQQPCYS